MLEFSFGIPAGDLARFHSYGIPLSESTDFRFGPCVRDELRGTGLANALMPLVVDVATFFNKSRILLWGGVFLSNIRAIRFYEKHGFRQAGEFLNAEGERCVDMLLNIEDFGIVLTTFLDPR